MTRSVLALALLIASGCATMDRGPLGQLQSQVSSACAVTVDPAASDA